MGWPVADLDKSVQDLEALGLHFERGLDNLGDIEYSEVEDTPVGLVLFAFHLQYPASGIGVEVDCTIPSSAVFSWLESRFGITAADYLWRTEVELEPSLAWYRENPPLLPALAL